MAQFDLNDDGVVVIVGSGAGGGTLGNELAQKGVKVVILEAGDRTENQEFVNNEWERFSSRGRTCAPPPAPGGSRTIFPTCPPGS
jgi:choline dehydrogenase-like flavoprotein